MASKDLLMFDAQQWVDKCWETDTLPWHVNEPFPSLVKYCDKFIGEGKKRIFMPMSGKSLDQIWLANKGHEVVGVEFSEKGVKATFEQHNLEYYATKQGKFDVYKPNDPAISLTIYRGDFFHLDCHELGKFDAIWDKGGYCILNEEQRQKYAKFIPQILKSKGKLLLITTFYDEAKIKLPAISLSDEYLVNMFGGKFEIETLVKFKKETMPKEWNLEDEMLLITTLLTVKF